MSADGRGNVDTKTLVPIAILFGDVKGSTADAEHDERAAVAMLREYVNVATSTAERFAPNLYRVKIEGDGFLATFTNAHTMVECGVALQREFCRRGWQVRLGGHVGEVYPTELGDIVGTDVNRAARIQSGANAAGAQFLVSDAVRAIIRNRMPHVRFEPHAPIAAKGVPEALVVFEVLPAAGQPAGASMPADHSATTKAPAVSPAEVFVGRVQELQSLNTALEATRDGHGRLVLLVGEAGIGKTRTAAEFTTTARNAGALVLWGGCYDGEWAPPFGPFAEAIAAYARRCDGDTLRDDLGFGAAPIARVVPAVRERLPDLPEPAPLQPDEERFRLFDAVSQFLIALSKRTPLVLVLDDLHWADNGSMAMLRHVARFAPQHQLLLLGAYRDVELDPQHPLTNALGSLYRETTCERVLLQGLATPEVAQLIADSDVPPDSQATLATALGAVTNGNPFFVREVLHHLVANGQLEHSTGARLRIPDSVRQVLGHRVRRLSVESGRLLSVASAFGGPFHLGVAARVAGLDDAAALNVIDEMLRAQLVRPSDSAERYDFTHALIRETLYSELSPSRHVRLHRQLAEAMEQIYGDRVGEHAAEIAHQYYRSKDLQGAERGVGHAIVAAERAEGASAWDEVATFLRMALDMMGPDDSRQPRALARQGRALALIPAPDAVLAVVGDAVSLLERSEGADAATEYLSAMMELLHDGGLLQQAFTLAQLGLARVGTTRDRRWARFAVVDWIGREASNPNGPPIPIDTPERWEIARLFDPADRPGYAYTFIPYSDRKDALARRAQLTLTGEFRATIRNLCPVAERWEREGRLPRALETWSMVARCYTALGELMQARATRDRAVRLARRLTIPSVYTATLVTVEDELRLATDADWDEPMENIGPGMDGSVLQWWGGAVDAAIARIHARQGRVERALRRLSKVIPVIERAPAWSEGYIPTVCDAAEVLWLTGRTDHVETIEHHLREKVVVPDFRYPMMDGRLGLARLSALQCRCEESAEWFAKARTVLDEQGARPLRAVVDYDEALMYARRGAYGDRERSRPLLEAALAQFRSIGMPGWTRRAEHLLATGREWSPEAQSGMLEVRPPETRDEEPPTRDPRPDTQDQYRDQEPDTCVMRCEGDVWSIAFAGSTHRIKDSRGLRYLALLFAHPGRELHASEIVALSAPQATVSASVGHEQTNAPDLGDAGEVLDAAATAQYKRRLTALREELAEAEANNDLGRTAGLRRELELLLAALTDARRGRRAASHAERARSAVSKRIRSALKQISAVDPQLGRYLHLTVRTGTFCSYRPAPALQIQAQ